MRLAATCSQDQPLCMQLYGTDAAVLSQAAVWAAKNGAAIVDINMGCPVDKVTKKNGGSKLLCDPVSAVRLAKQVVEAVPVPVTAKIRLGWDDQTVVGPFIAPMLADVGVAALTVHGRTAQQKFRGSCRLDGIAQVVAAMKHHSGVPVVGNGDVKSPEDAKHMLDTTGCHGVMIGRGALGQPWIFRDTAYYLATGKHPVPLTRSEKARLVVEHFDLLCQWRGEQVAIKTIRQRTSGYSASLQPWPGLRRAVLDIQTANEFRDFMAAGIERIQAQEIDVAYRSPIGT